MKAINTSADQSNHEVADIFRCYGEEYRSRNGLSKRQHEVMYAVERCRTNYYGKHVDECDQCGHIEEEYNSCRDRHCPKCQGINRRKWVDARLADILPVPYYHAIFTLPHFLNPLASYNRALVCDLLFSCASDTLQTFGRDPKWLGGEIGFYGVLHTWGQTLWQHLHVHFIVPGGALKDNEHWVEPKSKDKFLFSVKAMSKVFRGKFIEGLKAAYDSNSLIIPKDLATLKKKEAFEHWVDNLVNRDWVVYCKPPFGDAEQVVRYIGRYTHRVAISNGRIIDIKNGRINFRYKDYKAGVRVWKEMDLTASEFIRRFLSHVLPERFHKIRHYGYLANGRCKAMISQIKRLIQEKSVNEAPGETKTDRPICPECKKGWMLPILIIDGFERIIRSSSEIFCGGFIFDTS